MTLDDLLSEVSYRLPKGYPTIVNGKFVDREEVLLINKFLLEYGFSELPVPEAAKVKSTPSKFEEWYSKQNETFITPFMETVPLVEAMVPGTVTLDVIIKTVEGNKNMDWKPEALKAISAVKRFQNDPASVDFINNKYLKGKSNIGSPIVQEGVNMKQLNGNKPIDSFIHGKINEFYNYIETGEVNKVFTADVILFWGVDDPFDTEVLGAVAENLTNPKIVKDVLVDLGKGRLMACVSLKASRGRIGKMTQYLSRYGNVGDDVQTEGIGDSVKALLSKLAQTKIGQTVIKAYNKLKQMFSSLYDSVKNAVSPSSKSVSDYNSVSTSLKELNKLVDEAPIDEVDGDAVVCSTCMQARLLEIKPYVDKVLEGNSLATLESNLKTIAKDGLFVTKFTNLEPTANEMKQGHAKLKNIYTAIAKAKPAQAAGKGKCAPLVVNGKPLKVARTDLKNVIFTNGNAIAFELITNIINDAFKDIDINNLKEKRDALIKLAVTFSAEMVFGKSGALPLAKYTGKKLEKLGTKQQYIDKKSKSANNLVKGNTDLPVLALKIYPSGGKKGETPYYFNVYFYTLYTIEEPKRNEYTPEDVSYAVIAFKCNSGSKLAFAVEADKEVNGVGLKKDLQST